MSNKKYFIFKQILVSDYIKMKYKIHNFVHVTKQRNCDCLFKVSKWKCCPLQPMMQSRTMTYYRLTCRIRSLTIKLFTSVGSTADRNNKMVFITWS